MHIQDRAIEVLSAWDLPHDPRFVTDATGSALLALLCNAKAKDVPALYAHKSHLILAALELVNDAWFKPHTGYGEYPTDTVVFIETAVGRMQFHVRRDDPVLALAIGSLEFNERGWNGVALQPIARQLALEWLST